MSFPPATKITLGVRKVDIPLLEGMKSILVDELSNQIIAEEAILFVKETPLKVIEILPSTPAVITRLTHLSFQEVDFIPPENVAAPLLSEAHSPGLPPEVDSPVRPPAAAAPPDVKRVKLGVRVNDIPAIEKNSDILIEELEGIKAVPGKTIYFGEIPLHVLELDPPEPSLITKRTRISFEEHDFVPEDAPPPKAFETKQALYLALFLSLGIALFFLIYYLYTVFTGTDTFAVRYHVLIPKGIPIRNEILRQQSEILKKRFKSCKMEGIVVSKPDDTLEVRVRNYNPDYESVLVTRGAISFRCFEKQGYREGWREFISLVAIKSAEVKEGPAGLPEIHFSIPPSILSTYNRAIAGIGEAPVSLFMDGDKISGPLVKEELKRGTGVIRSKDLTKNRAGEIVIIMNSGTYPYPMEMVKQ